MRTRQFTDPNQTELLSGLIHDKWFPVARIHEDGDDLVIPFASHEVARASSAIFDSTLRIHHLRSWSVTDTEQIEIYDFYGLTFDASRNCIQIEGCIPLRIEATVGTFAVTIEMPQLAV